MQPYETGIAAVADYRQQSREFCWPMSREYLAAYRRPAKDGNTNGGRKGLGRRGLDGQGGS